MIIIITLVTIVLWTTLLLLGIGLCKAARIYDSGS